MASDTGSGDEAGLEVNGGTCGQQVGVGLGAAAEAEVVATDVTTEEVVSWRAEERAADSEATEPITEERVVVGGVAEEG